jgi:hypothetical protein
VAGVVDGGIMMASGARIARSSVSSACRGHPGLPSPLLEDFPVSFDQVEGQGGGENWHASLMLCFIGAFRPEKKRDLV